MHAVHLEPKIMIPMRDGVRLATDAYFPADSRGKRINSQLPVILVRTSYNKTATEWDGVPEWYVQRGFVFVIQDIRSRYQSEGDGRYYHTCNPWESDDGYDTVEWLARQSWSNGKIGMMGSSHRAIVQTQAALHSPPHLVTICPEQGPTNIYLHEAREGGVLALHMYTAIYNHALDSHELRDKDDELRELTQGLADSKKWINSMPFQRGKIPLSVAPHLEETFFNYYHRGEYDEWWAQECNDQTAYWDRHADIPVLVTGGWYDPFVDACTDYFSSMKQHINSTTKMIIGPWGHGTMRENTTSLGDLDFGKSAMLGYPAHHELRKRWFERWLNDTPNGVEEEAPIEIFVMGGGSGNKTKDGLMDHGGQWRNEFEWPIARTRMLAIYMTSKGTLEKKPPGKQNSISYTHDPEDPVPSAGGNIAHLLHSVKPEHGWDPVPKFGTRSMEYNAGGSQIVPWGPIDQRQTDWLADKPKTGEKLSYRPDVITFRSDVLKTDTEVTGQVLVKLWVSSSAPDTDFTAKLVDVYPPNSDYPEGYEVNISDTVLRMRYRNSWTDPEFMNVDTIYPIIISLPATSNLFTSGHRIRIDIASSNFPRLEVNPNTGQPVGRQTATRKAINTVHFGLDSASHILLPIIPSDR